MGSQTHLLQNGGDFIGFQEDLRYPSNGINPPGAISDPGRNTTTGLLQFDASSTEIIAGVAQFPHGWAEGSSITPHIHIRGVDASDPGGTQFTRWTLDYKWYNQTAVTPAAYTTDTQDFILPAHIGGVSVNLLAEFTAVSGSGKIYSSLFEWKLSRIGGSDTYVGDCVLLEFDIHYLHYRMGYTP